MRLIPLALSLAFALPSHAERLLRVDATQPAPAVLSGHFKMGTAHSAKGHTLTVSSQYLVLDGKPWLPVMGEFHFARSPEAGWEAELRKIKAAGVDIVSSYVFWNYHEQQPGRFDWTGNRNLHKFVQTAAKAGLKVVLRIGPWVHAEARFGGLPDWVVNTMPVRRNDPVYLRATGRFYRQIADQVRGLLWKNDGPLIGVQFENELDHAGEDGIAHIAALKKLGQEAGLDLPLYTVFGTSKYLYPPGEVTPTFGGYADRPWGTELGEIAPKGSYAFTFDSRIAGDIGQQEGVFGASANGHGREAIEKSRVPFLGAEYGGGLPQMYRRRTPLQSQDVPALLTVQVGSGSNMLGYYMFHGGRNPRPAHGTFSLEESTLSGGYNDTPQVNYDFEAPLGPDGQQRESLTRIRRLNQFLNAFGQRLAPMVTRKPDLLPASAADMATPRYTVRAEADRAFLFVNNHVRQAPMADFDGVRFSVALPGRTMQLPRQAMTVKKGDHFFWPLNFDLDGTQLVYATAQPVTRLDAGKDGVVYVFAQTTGQAAEFAFAEADQPYIKAPLAKASVEGGTLFLNEMFPGTTPVLSIQRPGTRPVRVLLLSEQQSRTLVVTEFAGQTRLLLTAQQVWATPQGLELRSIADAEFRVAMFPAPRHPPQSTLTLSTPEPDGIFQTYAMKAREYSAEVSPQLIRAAQTVPPIKTGGQANGALQPSPEVWGAAASWQLKFAVPALPFGDVDDLLIETDYVGDIGRMFAGEQMIDDWYYNGTPWQLGLRAIPAALRRKPLSLSVMPLRADAPIYIPAAQRPDFAGKQQVAELRSIKVTPIYKASLTP